MIFLYNPNGFGLVSFITLVNFYLFCSNLGFWLFLCPKMETSTSKMQNLANGFLRSGKNLTTLDFDW